MNFKKVFLTITLGMLMIIGLASCNNFDTNTDVNVDSTK